METVLFHLGGVFATCTGCVPSPTVIAFLTRGHFVSAGPIGRTVTARVSTT